ncbi:hypothetical protein OF83DRAFT_1171546 [Amylostereum chailletii]|nr:hypothetical protein OF83DRAFT_1171546 [Amylostereum chailletii]
MSNSGRGRAFSRLSDAQHETNDAILLLHGLPSNRVSSTTYTFNAHGSVASTSSSGGSLNLKRRRTGPNLNERYDRMIDTVALISRTPTSTSGTSPRKRKRIHSPESSSIISTSSHDVPKTPRTMGKDSTSIKLKGSSPEEQDQYISRHEPMPLWLSSTISTLEPHHPLRKLVPELGPGKERSIQPPDGNGDDIFAFQPPEDAGTLLQVIPPIPHAP